jgi:hypothetical protein
MVWHKNETTKGIFRFKGSYPAAQQAWSWLLHARTKVLREYGLPDDAVLSKPAFAKAWQSLFQP